MIAVRLWVCLAVAVFGAGRMNAVMGSDVVLNSCLVKVLYEARIPAPVAGVLIEMQMKEGVLLKKGDTLAIIDDREAAAALKIAQYGYESAVKRSEDQIEEMYATKAAQVAQIEWKKLQQANRDKAGAVAEIDILQKRLVVERSTLQIEKAKKDQVLAGLDANTKKAELDAAQMAIDWRKITAPVDGEIESIYRHQDEWVNPRLQIRPHTNRELARRTRNNTIGKRRHKKPMRT